MAQIQIKELENTSLYDLSNQESKVLVGGAVAFISSISGIPESALRLAAEKVASGLASELEKIFPQSMIPSSGDPGIDDGINKLYQGQNLSEALFNAGLR